MRGWRTRTMGLHKGSCQTSLPRGLPSSAALSSPTRPTSCLQHRGKLSLLHTGDVAPPWPARPMCPRFCFLSTPWVRAPQRKGECGVTQGWLIPGSNRDRTEVTNCALKFLHNYSLPRAEPANTPLWADQNMEKGQELKLKPFLKPHTVNSRAVWRTELPFLLLQALFPGISDKSPTCAQDKQATREQFQYLTSACSSPPLTHHLPPHPHTVLAWRALLAGPTAQPSTRTPGSYTRLHCRTTVRPLDILMPFMRLTADKSLEDAVRTLQGFLGEWLPSPVRPTIKGPGTRSAISAGSEPQTGTSRSTSY